MTCMQGKCFPFQFQLTVQRENHEVCQWVFLKFASHKFKSKILHGKECIMGIKNFFLKEGMYITPNMNFYSEKVSCAKNDWCELSSHLSLILICNIILQFKDSETCTFQANFLLFKMED